MQFSLLGLNKWWKVAFIDYKKRSAKKWFAQTHVENRRRKTWIYYWSWNDSSNSLPIDTTGSRFWIFDNRRWKYSYWTHSSSNSTKHGLLKCKMINDQWLWNVNLLFIYIDGSLFLLRPSNLLLLRQLVTWYYLCQFPCNRFYLCQIWLAFGSPND